MSETEPAKRPAYDAVDGDGKEAFWSKIGAAWPHDDGKGLNLQLTAIPLSGRIALRVPKEKRPTASARGSEEEPGARPALR